MKVQTIQRRGLLKDHQTSLQILHQAQYQQRMDHLLIVVSESKMDNHQLGYLGLRSFVLGRLLDHRCEMVVGRVGELVKFSTAASKQRPYGQHQLRKIGPQIKKDIQLVQALSLKQLQEHSFDIEHLIARQIFVMSSHWQLQNQMKFAIKTFIIASSFSIATVASSFDFKNQLQDYTDQFEALQLQSNYQRSLIVIDSFS